MFNQYPYINENDLNLDWVIKQIKAYTALVDSLETWKDEHEAEYLELKTLYDAVMSGNFPPSIVDGFEKWFKANALNLVGSMIDMVVINITDDGYLVAYIPESWNEIIFGTTGLDITIAGYDYGHLVLSYDV